MFLNKIFSHKLLSNQNRQKLFLCKTAYFTTDSKVDLILSPEFYWVRIFEIPVKSKSEAMEVVPTLFEDILPAADFSYHAIKLEHNVYLCFAYENNTILEYIKKSNLNLSQISNIYFAQTELDDTKDFEFKNDSFTYSTEGILIKVPRVLVSNTVEIEEELRMQKLSSNKIHIKFYSTVIESKFTYSFIFILSFLAVLNVVKYFVYEKNISILEVKTAQVKQSYNMPMSMIETNSILSKMKRTVSKDIKLRDSLDYIFKYKKGSAKGKIQKIKYSGNLLKIEFKGVNYAHAKNYLQKKFKIINNFRKKDVVSFEVKI